MMHINPVPPLSAKTNRGPFFQSVLLTDDDLQIGRAAWYCADTTTGVAQLLELWIDPELRRTGHGRRLLHAVIEQIRAHHRSHKQNLRRLWIGVGHKQQVIGRSFLTKEGFHHIGSAGGILDDQDMLIYVKSFD